MSFVFLVLQWVETGKNLLSQYKIINYVRMCMDISEIERIFDI